MCFGEYWNSMFKWNYLEIFDCNESCIICVLVCKVCGEVRDEDEDGIVVKFLLIK